VKQRLLQKCTDKFINHCKTKGIASPETYIKEKVWHHSFDPHTMMDEIELAPLQPQPQSWQKSESLE